MFARNKAGWSLLLSKARTLTSPSGFTFTELLITLSIILVLFTLCAPSAFHFYHQQRCFHYTHLLRHTLEYARMEAIKRRETTQVCGSSDGIHCDHIWTWILVIAGKEILYTEVVPSSIQISAPNKAIPYTKEGRCLLRTTLRIHSKDKSVTKKIVLYDSGRSRSE